MSYFDDVLFFSIINLHEDKSIMHVKQEGAYYMTHFRKIINNMIIVLIIATIAFLSLDPFIFADQNQDTTVNNEYTLSDETIYGYSTEKFDVDIKVNKDYTYDVTERIDVNFATGKHGIVRNIPFSKNYKIKNVKVIGEDFKKYNENNNLNIRIGKKSKTHIGKKSYTIKYKLVNYEELNSENSIYVDVLPTGWETGIVNARVKVKLPKDFKYKEMKSYSGSYGIDADNYGIWTYDGASNSLNFTCENLPRSTGVTLQVKTPAGYWQGAHSRYWSNYASLIVIALVLAIIAGLRIKKGIHTNIISPVNFNAPEGLTPAEIGYLVDNSVDKKDITSLFFYLASKGYISIKDGGKNKDEFTFTSLKIPENEPKFVRKFYHSLFGSTKENSLGKSVWLESASKKIGNNFSTIKNQIEDKFTGEKAFFSKESIVLERIALFVAAIGYGLLVILNMYRGSVFTSGIVAAAFACIVGSSIVSVIWLIPFMKVRKILYFRKTGSVLKASSSFILWSLLWIIISIIALALISSSDTISVMVPVAVIYLIAVPLLTLGFRDRSSYNAKIYGEIIGFRFFIETAELDRINTLVEENPSYFYDILPYAYVFGLTKKWINKFNQIEIPESDSYMMNGVDNFNYMRMGYMVDTIQKNSFSEIHASLRSYDLGGGGGDISFGGGFSGGGSGGGGGGAW